VPNVYRHLVKVMPLGDFFEEQFKFAEIFNMLKLNDEETALLTGVMIMNPGELVLTMCCYSVRR